MDDLYVKGISKFDTEIEYGLRIPEDKRYLVKLKNKHKQEMSLMLDESGSEEILASHFESRILY